MTKSAHTEYTPEQIQSMREKWDIPSDFFPVATVSGVCIAWVKGGA